MTTQLFSGLKLSAVLLIVLLTGCATSTSSASLYDKLGGKNGVEQLTDSFIKQIVNDEKIFPYFAKASVTHFKKGFQLHICDVADGPCTYDGDNMQDIHTGMNIPEADFNRTVELLIAAMEENGISYPVQNELLSRLAPMRKDILKI